MPIRNQGEPHQNGSKHLMAASKNSSCSAGFQSPDAEFTLLVPRSGSGRGFKRKCQNLIRERLLCFCSPRRPGKVIKTAACPCRRLRGGGSRQDGKVHRKKEKCKRDTAQFKDMFKHVLNFKRISNPSEAVLLSIQKNHN
ncbi:hypothetical protein AV530_013419 [Patagioenas fasciata monilis]|uniref:Uncharacterized protein n=1 Tax=Patagioenas fasciata monilis TaxID=372326 RepID=A0A1V4JPE9_PATFA|nr:hypothetical protein AV530_013419 [Patagioenas fasciata monilis]